MTEDHLQANYYEQTANSYEAAHLSDGDEHFVALEYMAGICAAVRAASALDIGAGTGRAVRHLALRQPAMRVVGLEPVEGLRELAIQRGGGEFFAGSGEELPFKDDEFDVVIATAVMHHVPDPDLVIAEMTRVARTAVMISDANRYGSRRPLGGLVKLCMRATGTWNTYMQLKTRGKCYLLSEGDGVFYSYSLYDSIPHVSSWADRTFVIPTKGDRPRQWSGPLLTAPAGLLVGVREPCFPGWAEASNA